MITTVSSDEKAALARAAGADHVVNYRETTPPGRSARSHPTASTSSSRSPRRRTTASTSRCVKHGTVVDLRQQRRRRAHHAAAGGVRHNLRYQFIILYTLRPELAASAAADVTAAVAAGALQVGEAAGLPLHHYPLEETAAAHDAVENGAVGKVLVAISD